jgi:MFS family permease
LGVGILVLALGLFLSSLTQEFWHLVVAYGVIAGLGITILGLGPQASLIARWFVKRRGVAIGLAFAGTGLGTLVLTPGLDILISSVGWRTAYLILAGLALVGLPFNILLLRLNPEDKGLFPDGERTEAKGVNPDKDKLSWRINQAIRVPSFWLLILASFGAIGPVRMLTVHQLAAITDVGFSSSFAAGFVGASGAVTSLVFILSGALSDRIGRRLTYALGSISLLMAILILDGLSSARQISWLSAYVVLLGFGEGSRSSLVTAFASDLFPGEHVGAINGAVGAAFGLGAAILPWMAGLVYDTNGEYTIALNIAMGLIVISAIALWVAPAIHRGQKANQTD